VLFKELLPALPLLPADSSHGGVLDAMVIARVRLHISARAPQVVGLQDSYHGDTLGAMDCGAPSAYNGPRQTPWRGPQPYQNAIAPQSTPVPCLTIGSAAGSLLSLARTHMAPASMQYERA